MVMVVAVALVLIVVLMIVMIVRRGIFWRRRWLNPRRGRRRHSKYELVPNETRRRLLKLLFDRMISFVLQEWRGTG
jgi:hypothetical protein